MHPTSPSQDRGLLRLLFVFIAIGLALCWVLTTNPDALAHGPQVIPQLLANLHPSQAQAAQSGAGLADGVLHLQGTPSLSADFLEQVLTLAHSPAAGKTSMI